MPGIFVSYRRRGESTGYAGRLAADLRGHFGADQIFRDIEQIEPGADFVEVITNAVSSCSVLIAVIGPDWLTTADASGRRRLDDPQDFLHLEVVTALSRGVRVIPVLVGGATMPRAEDLPDPLKPLARRQAHEFSEHRWAYDEQQLFKMLQKAGVRPSQSRQLYRPLLRHTPVKWALGLGLTAAVALALWLFWQRVIQPSLGSSLPTIVAFQATPATIRAEDSSVLSWETNGAEHVALETNNVLPSGSATVHPLKTTTYHLTARSGTTQVAESLTVQVADVPPAHVAAPVEAPKTAQGPAAAVPAPKVECQSGTGTALPGDEVQAGTLLGYRPPVGIVAVPFKFDSSAHPNPVYVRVTVFNAHIRIGEGFARTTRSSGIASVIVQTQLLDRMESDLAEAVLCTEGRAIRVNMFPLKALWIPPPS